MSAARWLCPTRVHSLCPSLIKSIWDMVNHILPLPKSFSFSFFFLHFISFPKLFWNFYWNCFHFLYTALFLKGLEESLPWSFRGVLAWCQQGESPGQIPFVVVDKSSHQTPYSLKFEFPLGIIPREWVRKISLIIGHFYHTLPHLPLNGSLPHCPLTLREAVWFSPLLSFSWTLDFTSQYFLELTN